MMERAFVSHAVLLSLSVLLNVVSASANASFEVAAQREFDYFALALQWPGTFCQRTRHCCSSNGCCGSSQLTEFTIHGLWPDYYDGSYPSCCSSSDFDIKKISSLMPVLQKYWPSLSCGSPSVCHGGKGLFWAHEWEKHGTCSYPVIKDEYSYFSKALDLYSMYNITRILSTEGIFTSNSVKYPVGDIISAIQKATGALPLLECRGSFLEELQLCFDKAFKPRNCLVRSSHEENALSSRKSCPVYISFPTYSPLGYGLNGDFSSAVSWLFEGPSIPFNVV